VPERVAIEDGVVVGSGGGRPLRADVFTPPPGRSQPAPAVLLVHGGGWRDGDRTQLRGYGILLGRAGYVCVACEYRLLPEAPWPAQIEDVKAALRWMRANADHLGIDPGRIAIEGNSAGAHLALLAAGTPSLPEFEGDGGNPGVSTAVSAAIGVYAPTSFQAGAWEWGSGAAPLEVLHPGGDEELARAVSPITYVGPGYPATLLIHGNADKVVHPAASLRMYEALATARVSTELHMYADQPHAFDALPGFGRQCAAEMLLFLQRYL
jgi:acetyl esterase/lipase